MTTSTLTVDSTGSQAADAAVELADLAGLDLNERQVESLREGLRIRQDGTWEHLEHQCRDQIVLEARVLAGLLLFSDQRVFWAGLKIEDTFRRLASRLTDRPQLSGQVETIRRANGDQLIELVNGSRLGFIDRSLTGAGRGVSADLLIVDDSTGLSCGQHAEMEPTVWAALVWAAPNPQIWYGR